MPVIRELKRLSAHDKVPLRAEDQERYYAQLALSEQHPEAEQVASPNPTTDQAGDDMSLTEPKE